MPVQGNEGPDDGDETTTIMVDKDTGHVTILEQDGSVTIDTDPDADKRKADVDTEFDDNLAEHMSETDLDALGQAIWEGVENDLKTRADFERIFEKAIDLLGIKMEEASSQASSEGTVSRVYSPLLLETVVKYQANFVAEMLPANGPCKVKDDHNADPEHTPNPNDPVEQIIEANERQRDEIGEAFEKDVNHYLTVTDKGFYPDTDKMSFVQGFCGNGFKKQYHHPLKRRPVSESIPPQDLIVSNNANDLYSAQRVTHRTKMGLATLKRMQLNKTYRKCDIATPQPTVTQTEQKIGLVEGIDKTPQLPGDYEFTIYETLIDIDLKGFEHKDEDGEPTGLPLPYKVTLERDSKKVLAIHRNWEEEDDECQKEVMIVHFPLIPGLGFYAYGFYHLLGNTTRALTGITRLLLDAGQFATFPGFLLAKGGSKQTTNEIRVAPGTGKEIDTGGKPIREVVMELPYKEPSQALLNMAKQLGDDGMRLGGAGNIPVGEGRVDVPVGTMLAAIEQTTKVMGAIHKRNHQAQQQELLNLKKLFMQDPTSLSRFAKTPARKWEVAEEFSDKELVPASDPNVPSQIHRIMLAQALIQLASTPAGMQIYNQIAVHERALRVLGIADPASLFNPPTPPQAAPPDPNIALKNRELDIKQQQNQLKAQDQQTDMTQQQREASETMLDAQQHSKELQANLQDKREQRAHDLTIEQMKTREEIIKADGKNTASLHQEKVKGLAGMQQEHLKGVHGLIASHVDHAHAKDLQASAPKPAPAGEAKPGKAKPKTKPKTTGAKK